MPHIVFQYRNDRSQSPARQHRLDLRCQPIAPGLGGINRRDVVLEGRGDVPRAEIEARRPAPI
jgi:hypothetical protein